MTKAIFVFFVVLIVISAAGWLFIRKGRQAQESTIHDVTASLGPSVEPSPSISEGKMTTLEGGLQIQDIVAGSGAQAGAGDTVSVNYVGMFTDGRKFDNSYDRGQPFQFTLGGGQVIKGWDQGVAGMRVGGKRKLIIPPALAYGQGGAGNGLIPPNATLVFEVELLAVQKPQR